MGSETPRTTRDPEAKPRCPACGQPLETVAKRHKVLGAWVPEWEVQPCRNPQCERYVPEHADPERADRDGRDPEEAPDTAPEGGAEATTTHVTGKNDETGRSPAPG